MTDERLIGALHLSTGALGDDLGAAHAAFQTSTVAALLDGAYEGDVSFAELAHHGDFGIGTLNGCDGEMIATDGLFFHADVEGRITEIDPGAKTPFAVLTEFEPNQRFELGGGEEGSGLDFDQICTAIDERVGDPGIVHAIRIDGSFARVHCRSVPKQDKPYRPLAEVLATQSIFDFDDTAGTLLGFRFPDLGLGIGIAGYHLHYINNDRTQGGHVLDCRLGPDPAKIAVDDLSDLYVETPPGVAIGGKVDQAAVTTLEREPGGQS